MNCPRCQQVLSDDAHFCSACGSPTVEIDPQKTLRLETQTLKYSTDPLMGQVLDAKYRITGRLGEGGMGIVYSAHRVHIGDDVAIKVLHSQFVRDAKAVERFRREARSAAAIRHPNVVTVYDFNEAKSEGAPAYIVMELVRGTSLRELIQQEGRLSPAHAIELMEQICAGVGAGHRQGIVHRDLKPDNIIVVPPEEGVSETVKILDFGLAKLRDASAESALTETGAMVGTPSYMPPEQCRGEELDARSDVYSLGAILYEMLTGERPFPAPTVAAVIAKHLYELPAPFPPNINTPSALQAVCLRALTKDREARPANATELNRELQTALTSSRVTAPSHTSLDRSAAPQKSSWLRWTAIAVLGIVIMSIGGITYLRHRLTAIPLESSNRSKPSQVGADQTNSPENTATTTGENASRGTNSDSLLGTWTGTYGVMNSPASLTVQEHKGSTWSGLLEQGGVRVAFNGNVDESSRKITFKETRVLTGSGWSLGENSGELSADRRTMSGTGQDATGAQLGMSYQWSFSRQ